MITLAINNSVYINPLCDAMRHRSPNTGWLCKFNNNVTWNLRMMVQIKPSVSLALPSTISCAPIFSNFTAFSPKKVRDLSTFSRQWILIFPLVGRGYGKRATVAGCHIDHSFNFIVSRHKVGQGIQLNIEVALKWQPWALASVDWLIIPAGCPPVSRPLTQFTL